MSTEYLKTKAPRVSMMPASLARGASALSKNEYLRLLGTLLDEMPSEQSLWLPASLAHGEDALTSYEFEIMRSLQREKIFHATRDISYMGMNEHWRGIQNMHHEAIGRQKHSRETYQQYCARWGVEDFELSQETSRLIVKADAAQKKSKELVERYGQAWCQSYCECVMGYLPLELRNMIWKQFIESKTIAADDFLHDDYGYTLRYGSTLDPKHVWEAGYMGVDALQELIRTYYSMSSFRFDLTPHYSDNSLEHLVSVDLFRFGVRPQSFLQKVIVHFTLSELTEDGIPKLNRNNAALIRQLEALFYLNTSAMITINIEGILSGDYFRRGSTKFRRALAATLENFEAFSPIIIELKKSGYRVTVKFNNINRIITTAEPEFSAKGLRLLIKNAIDPHGSVDDPRITSMMSWLDQLMNN